MKKNIIEILKERQFIDDVTSEELVKLVNSPIKCYVGFDPTAESLHLGNLVGIVALTWFQRYGHTPYFIVGGATGKIGDPSGKSSERTLLTDEVLSHNISCIKKQLERFLDFSHPHAKPVMVNNNDWYCNMSITEFLRDVGKHFRIGAMLGKDSVRSRMQSEEGMSYTEFSYQLLQAYDFSFLNKKHGVQLQMGGSDQWGNITAGIEFARRMGQDGLYGLTFPLLTRSDGKKFGKSEGGAIWLSSSMCSPYKFYQYLYRVADADVIQLLRMLTFLDMEEILELDKGLKEGTLPPNTAQKKLAEEVTRFVHGEEGLEAAIRVTQAAVPGANAILDGKVLHEIKEDIPSCTLTKSEVITRKCTDIMVLSKLLPSKSEAVRLIKNGGAYLNNKKIENPDQCLEEKDLIDGEFLLFGAGKKTKLLIQVC